MKWALMTSFLLFSNINFAQSIYQIDPIKDSTIIASTSIASLLAYSNSGRLIQPRCPCSPDEINSFDRGAVGNSSNAMDRTSDVTAAASVLFPIGLSLTELGFSKEFFEDMTVYAETISVNAAMVTFAKYTVQRPLPRTYANDPYLVNDPRGYRSFYSGHTSLVVSALTASAISYTTRHRDSTWPWYLLGFAGISVAYERVEAGRHFPSDVIVGALAGAGVGAWISYSHMNPNLKNHSVGLIPIFDGGLVYWKMSY